MFKEIDEDESMEEESVMTRTEWIEYAREECEKQLPVIEEIESPEIEEEINEDELHAVYIPIEQEESEEDKQQSLFEDDNEEEPDDSLFHSMIDEEAVPVGNLEKIKWSYMTKIGIRALAALVIMAFAICVNVFGIRTKYISDDIIKRAIKSNDSIEKIEEAVSSCFRNK